MVAMSLWRWVVLLGALGPLVYYVLAIFCGWDYFAKRAGWCPDLSFHPPVSILKPVRGVDREAYENFASFCRLDYPDYEILFAVSDADDSVIPVIETLQRSFPDRQIRLLTGAAQVGANSKVNKLCRLVREARHDVLAISDSDARVEPDYLREMVAPLAKPDVGMVTALFRGLTGGGFFSSSTRWAFRLSLRRARFVAPETGRQHEVCLWLVHGDDEGRLAEIGGFEGIANYHSDDFELGNRIASKGYRVELMRKWIWMVFPRETLPISCSTSCAGRSDCGTCEKPGIWPGIDLWAALDSISRHCRSHRKGGTLRT